MTAEEEPPPIRRFRWAKSRNSYGRAIEGIAALWVDGTMSRAEAREDLRVLESAAREDVQDADISTDRLLAKSMAEYRPVFSDIFCVRMAIDESERREDMTAEERLEALRVAIKRLQPGWLQR